MTVDEALIRRLADALDEQGPEFVDALVNALDRPLPPATLFQAITRALLSPDRKSIVLDLLRMLSKPHILFAGPWIREDHGGSLQWCRYPVDLSGITGPPKSPNRIAQVILGFKEWPEEHFLRMQCAGWRLGKLDLSMWEYTELRDNEAYVAPILTTAQDQLDARLASEGWFLL